MDVTLSDLLLSQSPVGSTVHFYLTIGASGVAGAGLSQSPVGSTVHFYARSVVTRLRQEARCRNPP